MKMEHERRPTRKTSALPSEKIAIDKKRVFIALGILLILLGVGVVWIKDMVPRFLAQQEKTLEEKTRESGDVAGEADINFEQFQRQIDEIKNDVMKINVEDVKEQEAVKKILSDLESLKVKATESAKVLDVKGNLCEEAKKRFCE